MKSADTPGGTQNTDGPPRADANTQARTQAHTRRHTGTHTLAGMEKGAGVSRPLARVPSLVHERHLDATHQGSDNVVEHGAQRGERSQKNDVDNGDNGRVGDDAG